MTEKTKSFSKMLKAPSAHSPAPKTHQLPPTTSPGQLLSNARLVNIGLPLCLVQVLARGDKVSLSLLRHIDFLSEKRSREGLHQPLHIECFVKQPCPMVLCLHSQFQWGYPPPLTPYKGCPPLSFTQHIGWSLMYQAKQGDKCVVTAKIWKVRCNVWKYTVVWI